MMPTYRKRPVEVEAVKWTGGNATEIVELLGLATNISDTVVVSFPEIKIPTLEGVMSAAVGDYIIRGVQGECYPCKPDIFEATYERVD